MSTTGVTLASPAQGQHGHFAMAQRAASASATFTRNSDGTGRIVGLPIFKAGSFIDGYGFEATYESEHLLLMASHFSILRGVFPNVPVRANHGRSINDVVGYFSDLRYEGEFLVADIDLTEPSAVEKWERGTYRSVSSEIGFYETNSGALYYPVTLGVAFVDIPAVEGLFSKELEGSQGAPTRYFTEAIQPMSGTQTTQPSDTAPALAPSGQAPSVTIYAGTSNTGATLPNTTTSQVAVAPVQPAAAPAQPAEPTFQFAGKTMTSAEVQAHLDQMAQAQQEALEAGRLEFAKRLATENKLGAPQIDKMAALAKTLTGEQFTLLQEVYADAPVMSLLATHADGVSNPDGQKGEPTEAEKRLAHLEGVVRFNKMSGMDLKVLEETPSYKELQALKAAK